MKPATHRRRSTQKFAPIASVWRADSAQLSLDRVDWRCFPRPHGAYPGGRSNTDLRSATRHAGSVNVCPLVPLTAASPYARLSSQACPMLGMEVLMPLPEQELRTSHTVLLVRESVSLSGGSDSPSPRRRTVAGPCPRWRGMAASSILRPLSSTTQMWRRLRSEALDYLSAAGMEPSAHVAVALTRGAITSGVGRCP
jgi:hypothetical protein